MTTSIRLSTLALMLAACGAAAAQDIAPFQAQEVKPYQAQEVKPYQAEDVKPYQPQADAGQGRQAPQQAATGAEGARALLGAWQSGVSGAVWTSPSSIPGWDKLHVSPGALAGLLVIYPNGTYVWNSYGGKKGRWTTSSDPAFPIVLDDRVENKKWHVGLDRSSPGRIWIYDGNSISYSAKRPAR